MMPGGCGLIVYPIPGGSWVGWEKNCWLGSGSGRFLSSSLTIPAMELLSRSRRISKKAGSGSEIWGGWALFNVLAFPLLAQFTCPEPWFSLLLLERPEGFLLRLSP